jgi:hypothetical protein
VYLLAQIHRIRLEQGTEWITGTYPSNRSIEQLLVHSGFYGLLRVKSRLKADQKPKSTRYIKFKSDQRPSGEQIGKLRDELLGDDFSMPATVKRMVFRALSEAMINVHHHAYLQKSSPKALLGRWWLMASLSVTRNRFTLSFYDAGVGIPKTLPKRYAMEVIRHAVSLLPGILPNDGQMISAAMELRRTRTGLEHRGRGLMDLARLIDQVGDGHLDIFSRHGSYRYKPGNSDYSNKKGFVEGTLIEWHLPLDKALDEFSRNVYDEVTEFEAA